MTYVPEQLELPFVDDDGANVVALHIVDKEPDAWIAHRLKEFQGMAERGEITKAMMVFKRDDGYYATWISGSCSEGQFESLGMVKHLEHLVTHRVYEDDYWDD